MLRERNKKETRKAQESPLTVDANDLFLALEQILGSGFDDVYDVTFLVEPTIDGGLKAMSDGETIISPARIIVDDPDGNGTAFVEFSSSTSCAGGGAEVTVMRSGSSWTVSGGGACVTQQGRGNRLIVLGTGNFSFGLTASELP